nr:MAG TPA: hypothetical protein [Caudoviricetes sp.]
MLTILDRGRGDKLAIRGGTLYLSTYYTHFNILHTDNPF